MTLKKMLSFCNILNLVSSLGCSLDNKSCYFYHLNVAKRVVNVAKRVVKIATFKIELTKTPVSEYIHNRHC